MKEQSAVAHPWPGCLIDFSAFASRLYALVEDSPDAKFQLSALKAATQVLAFDSALWAVGAVTEEGSQVHSIQLYNQPPEMMAAWERIKHLDTLHQLCFDRMGEIVFATADGPIGGPPFDAAIRAHTHCYGMQQIAATIFVDPLSHLFTAISLYRSDAQSPFTADEQYVARCVVAHLTDAWRRQRILGLKAGRAISEFGVALADSHGVLHVASDQFMDLLRLEWPQWSGPRLPAQLAISKEVSSFRGQEVVASSEPYGGMIRHGLRRRHSIDSLTRREREVAQLFVSGLDHQKIAVRLNLAPETVRNHLKHAYAKTGLHNKAQLAQVMMQLREIPN